MTSSVQRSCSTFGKEMNDPKGGKNKKRVWLYELPDQTRKGWRVLVGHN